MKKFLSFVLLICIMFTMHGSSTALAYTDAEDHIFLYYQQASSKNEWSKLKLGGEGNTMGTSGCLIFAYAHAIQWLTGTKVSDTSLLTSMIKEGKYPWDYGIAYYAGKATMKQKGLGKIDGTISTDTLKSFFDNNHVIIANTSYKENKAGHYVLAVGYTERDVDGDGNADLLIQIVDSAVRATYKRFVKETSDCRAKKRYARGYNMYDFTTFKKYSSIPSEQCGQYWVKADEFISGMNKARVIIGITDPTKFYTKIDDIPRIAVSTKESSASDTCRLQSMPYDTTGYYTGVVEKGGIIYIKGAVKNSYGNTWYVTEDNLYVYKGDVEITEADASFSAKTAADFVGVVKTKDGYLKKKPFEAADHIDGGIVAKGKTVTIVGKVTNSHNNVWYVTDEGYYIYSGDVTTYVSTVLFPIDATFKNTEKRESHVVPYLDSAEKTTIKKNATVTVTKFVVNSHGNIWAQLKDGSYLCFYDAKTKENKLTFVSALSEPNVASVKKPTGDLTQGNTFGIRGVITTKVPFLTVSSHIINRETGSEAAKGGTPVTASPSCTTQKVDINASVNGTNINLKTMFSKLAAGWYHYEIRAQYGFTYEGKTFMFGSSQTLISSDFSIGKAGEEEPPMGDVATPTPKPTPSFVGNDPKLLGDVNDDGKVTLVDIMKTAKYVYDDNTIYINLANADMNGDGKINLVDIMKIARIVYPAPSVV